MKDLNETNIQNLEDLDLYEIIEKAKGFACTDFNFQELEEFKDINGALENLSNRKIAEYFYLYSFYIIGERFPVAESKIAKDPEYSYRYAIDVINGRFLEGELAISKDSEFAYRYARDVIRDKFPEGEPAIAKDTVFIYRYARDVIKGRFREGELAILQSLYLAKFYAEKFDCPEILEN